MSPDIIGLIRSLMSPVITGLMLLLLSPVRTGIRSKIYDSLVEPMFSLDH